MSSGIKDYRIGEKVWLLNGTGDTATVEHWDSGWFLRLDDGELVGPYEERDLMRPSTKDPLDPLCNYPISWHLVEVEKPNGVLVEVMGDCPYQEEEETRQ